MSKPSVHLDLSEAGWLGLYSIRDRIADEFGPVMTLKNHAVAFRNFQAFSKSVSENASAGLPTDYELVFLGAFHRTKGAVRPQALPRVITNSSGELEDSVPGFETGFEDGYEPGYEHMPL